MRGWRVSLSRGATRPK